jgi:ElaB/YqjD/DUF883 family membrane-anchored ribosome-binding protein
LSESDIEAAAAEFEKSMKTILGDDEELLRQWNEFAEKASSAGPGKIDSAVKGCSNKISCL